MIHTYVVLRFVLSTFGLCYLVSGSCLYRPGVHLSYLAYARFVSRIIAPNKNKNTLRLSDRRFRRNSSLQAVCDTPIARITGGVSSLRI